LAGGSVSLPLQRRHPPTCRKLSSTLAHPLPVNDNDHDNTNGANDEQTTHSYRNRS
jgi:hypothetical protein